ncbi:MAG: type II toxin-antitoxin system PemK/MazF family toxin [Acidithiobacillus sp.]
MSPIAASPNTGLQKPSQIMVDKPQTIPREKVGQMIGHLDYGIMLTVNRAMALFLGFA